MDDSSSSEGRKSPIEEIAQITPKRLDMDIRTRKSIISFNEVQKDLDDFHEKLSKLMMKKKDMKFKNGAVHTTKNTERSGHQFLQEFNSVNLKKISHNQI